jgi:hypothetical protein
MNAFTDFFSKIEAYLSDQEKKVAAFLKPIVDDLIEAAKKDLSGDLFLAIDAAVSAMSAGNGTKAILDASLKAVEEVAISQGKQLAQTTLTAVGAAVEAHAEASVQ